MTLNKNSNTKESKTEFITSFYLNKTLPNNDNGLE